MRALLATALAAAFLSLACGGDDGGPTASPAATATADPLPTASPGPTPEITLDLATAEPALTVSLDEGSLETGKGTLAAGDLDGDGTVDLVVGAPTADGPDGTREDAGEVHVLFNAAATSGNVQVSSAAGLTLFGASIGDGLGFAVGAADLNGDGTDDLIAGAPGVTAGADRRTDQGRVYVFFGSAAMPEAGSIDLSAGEDAFGFVLTGAEGFSRAGHALATGDVDGDGTDDLIVGAPFAGREPGTPPGGPRTAEGAIYVMMGGPDLTGEVNIAFDEPDFQVKGDEEFSQFGTALATGDVNGDGTADIIVGAPQEDSEGRPDSGTVSVFYGRQGLAGSALIGDADVTVYAAGGEDSLGFDVAAGDFDGDGTDALLASAAFADGPDNSRDGAGEVYRLDVSAPGDLDLGSISPGALVIGKNTGHGLGLALAAADFDGDGADDGIITAPLGSALAGTRTSAGEVFVVPGGNLTETIDLASSLDGYIYVAGARAGNESGFSALAVDLEGDGEPELVITSPGGGADDAPVVYVISLAGLTD